MNDFKERLYGALSGYSTMDLRPGHPDGSIPRTQTRQQLCTALRILAPTRLSSLTYRQGGHFSIH